MLSLTPAAVEQIRIAAAESGAETMALRVAAHFDPASREMHYGIGFDDAHDSDESFEIDGVSLLVSPLSRDALADLTIDYVEIEPGDFRFIFYRARDFARPAAEAAPRDPCPAPEDAPRH